MHGLINRALQRFAEDTHGLAVWSEVAQEAQPGLAGFEAMLIYDDAVTGRVVEALSGRTGTPAGMILEDLGTYLVCHPNTESLRRLLRFGGESFTDFLYSLDDLADRVRLAVPDLVLPPLELTEHAPGRFTLAAGPGLAGFGHVVVGLLRAMADDYGVLALVELLADGAEGAEVAVSVAEAAFAEGRSFDLALLRAGA
jgi:hypothetical protein